MTRGDGPAVTPPRGQVGALDVAWIGERVEHLSLDQQLAVDEALRLVLDL